MRRLRSLRMVSFSILIAPRYHCRQPKRPARRIRQQRQLAVCGNTIITRIIHCDAIASGLPLNEKQPDLCRAAYAISKSNSYFLDSKGFESFSFSRVRLSNHILADSLPDACRIPSSTHLLARSRSEASAHFCSKRMG